MPAAATPGASLPGQQAPQQPSLAQAGTADAVRQAAADPAAQQGIPQKSPSESGQPHSLSPDWYEHSEQLKMKAMHDAALAGQDPMKVGAAMDALRTSAVQGQVMRNYAAANAAFMSGDDKALKQALQNVNYYLPNGKGLEIKTATAADVAANEALARDPITGQPKPGYDPNMHLGALMYKSPFAGMMGHENDPPYTTITQQHISMLAQNAMNPSTVQEAMLKSYTAQRETQAKLMSASGAQMTGSGRQMLGQAAMTKADVDARMMPIRQALMRTQGAENLAHAGYYNAKSDVGRGAGPKITIANYNQAVQQASKAVDDGVQGPVSWGALTNPDGTPNFSPGAGRQSRDPTKAAPAFAGMSADDVNQTKMFAGQLAGANIGITTPMEAADAAARIVRYQKVPSSHPDPVTHKPTPDVIYDHAQNTAHVWDGHQMKNFFLGANISEAEGSPVESGGGSGAGEASESEESPEQTAGGDAFNSD